jgi:hypothetical protein
MYTRVAKRGIKNEERLLIVTTQKKGNEHSPGAVSYGLVGSEKNIVTIHSNVLGWGAIPIKGRENIEMLKDALILICKIGNVS